VDDVVIAREVALDQIAGGGVAGGAPVQAAEQQLDHLARELCRDEALGRRVERAHVERVRVSERRRRRAGRERLVHVKEVELGQLEQLFERPRHVQREGDRSTLAERERLPDGEH
jgi:hypothetical protein